MELEVIAAELVRGDDKIEVLQQLAEILIKKKYADQELSTAIIEREREFPTGLELKEDVNVAIPHADAKYVRKPVIVVAKLAKPVKFQHMVDRKEIDVDTIFLLALNEPHSQIQTLQKLASSFEDEKILLRIKFAKNSEELAGLLKEVLGKN
jgi:PTS system galactitol-specific IIA component